MAGLIWFVQLIHYPLLSFVGPHEFRAYEVEHVRRSGFVQAPLMALELASALLSPRCDRSRSARSPSSRGCSCSSSSGATFLVQVPLHRRLERGHDPGALALLVRTNWVRTACWTARAFLVLYMTSLTIC